MEQIENSIRDNLVNRLELIEAGLELLDKEHYLPNELGTRGFVDILAKDTSGRHVIIELKRTNSACREALHEVLKYIEGIKKNKKLKEDEIRAIIISTEWEELLVPFSSFSNRCNCSVMGFKLFVNDNLEPTLATKISPLELKEDRLLSDQHLFRLYTSEKSMWQGIDSHINCFRSKKISDYVFLTLKAPSDLKEREIVATMNSLECISKQNGFSSPTISREELEAKMPDYKYMIYSVIQVLSKEEYLRVISLDQNIFEEVSEFIDGIEEDELIATLHEYALAAEPTPHNERTGISYPAKFNGFLDDVGWEIVGIHKHGAFERNELLTDELIIAELRGSSGTNKTKYKKSFGSNSRASFSQMKREVQICLEDNLVWKQHIKNFIEEVEILARSEEFNGVLSVYNPSNTVYSVYLSTSTGDPLSWQPNYSMIIKCTNKKMMYFGGLMPNGKTATVKEVLDAYYEGNPHAFFLNMTWGGYEARDYRIASDFGLEYKSFKFTEDETGRHFYQYDGYEFCECPELMPFDGFINFLNQNPKVVKDVHEFFDEHTLAPGIWC